MDSTGARERALAQYGRASLAVGRVPHTGGEDRLARDCCRAFLQHCSSDPGGGLGCGTRGCACWVLVLVCRRSHAYLCCLPDTRALALVSQVREFMHVLDQRDPGKSAKVSVDSEVLSATVPAKTQTEPPSPPSVDPPEMPSEQTAVHAMAQSVVKDDNPVAHAKADSANSTVTPRVLATMAARMDRMERSLTDGLQRLQSLVSLARSRMCRRR